MKNNIILIGASGAGKSTFGRLLARREGKKFLDFDDDVLEKTDLETAKKALKTIKVFDTQADQISEQTVGKISQVLGSEKFLEFEGYMSNNLDLGDNTVLATSGSLPLVDSAMDKLKTKGKIVYLKSETNDIKSRIDSMKLDRIVGIPKNIYELSKENKLKVYETIMQERVVQYEKYSDITYESKKEEKINKQNKTETNKHGIKIIEELKKNPNKIEKIKFNFNKFYNFLKREGIVKI